MASLFRGMDPYLEQPAIWASFHSRLIVALADAIESALKPEYYVEVESRTYLSEEESGLLIGIPDVGVATMVARAGSMAEIIYALKQPMLPLCPWPLGMPLAENLPLTWLIDPPGALI